MNISIDSDPFIGAHFGLTLELGFAGNDDAVKTASAALWDSPFVQGPWSDRRKIGDIHGLTPDAARNRLERSRFGLLKTGIDQATVPFALYWMREEEDDEGGEASDWLSLDIPVSAFRSWPSANSEWSVASKPWLGDLCQTLAEVADHVHACIPIVAGAMGEEISGCYRRPTAARVANADQQYPPDAVLDAATIDARGGFVVSAELWGQLRPSAAPTILRSGLRYIVPKPARYLRGA